MATVVKAVGEDVAPPFDCLLHDRSRSELSVGDDEMPRQAARLTE